ncbi:hypothetical protein V6N13_088415 [Hibiscus sabdariffa]
MEPRLKVHRATLTFPPLFVWFLATLHRPFEAWALDLNSLGRDSPNLACASSTHRRFRLHQRNDEPSVLHSSVVLFSVLHLGSRTVVECDPDARRSSRPL